MGPDVIAIVSILVAILGSAGGLAALILPRQRRLEDKLESEVASVRGEIGGLGTRLRGEIAQLRTELRAEIGALGTDLRGMEGRLGGRIDAVRDELVETRVAMADRVARIEGRVFGVPLPDTGTDSA